MVESEGRVDVGLGLEVIAIGAMPLVQLVQQGLVAALGELALLVYECHEVKRAQRDEVQRLLVVHELDVVPIDGLQVVLLLLQLEDVLHEELLQVLVGKVDAELLERVGIEVLEAEYVENADGAVAPLAVGVGRVDQVLPEDGSVDLAHDVDEEAAVDAPKDDIIQECSTLEIAFLQIILAYYC